MLTYAASFLPFFVTGQYRVPVIPFLLILGAVGVVELVRALRERRWRVMAIGLAAGAIAYALAAVNVSDYEPNLAKWYFDRGAALGKHEQYDEAMQAYKAAIQANPALPFSYLNLGILYMRKGEFRQAESCSWRL